MFIIYDIIFIMFAAVYFPYLVVKGKWHAGYKMRFGDLALFPRSDRQDSEYIWIHAVSVGEVMAITGLIGKIREMFPQYKIVCSTVTETGNRLAKENLEGQCQVIYAPLDFSWIVRKFVRIINPKIYISTETEIWPNLYTALRKKGVPILQINGRISDKSFKGYKRLRFLTKRILACVNVFCMQSSLDAERIQALGAESVKVRIVGNLKFDHAPALSEHRNKDFKRFEGKDVLIAGSTHPGEDEILIDAYKTLVSEFRNLRLIIVPRHIKRADAIARLIQDKGYNALRYSENNMDLDDPYSILVVDKIGILRDLYVSAKIVFIGKSFTVGGAQNMIEPASMGKPTIVGPLTQNFKDTVRIFLEANAMIQVQDPQGLIAEVRHLLSDDEYAAGIGQRARKTVEENQGATLKTMKVIGELLTQN